MKLYARFKEDCRVEGDCGCRSPYEHNHGFATGTYHIDSPAALKGFAEMLTEIYNRPSPI